LIENSRISLNIKDKDPCQSALELLYLLLVYKLPTSKKLAVSSTAELLGGKLAPSNVPFRG
jgi:hypothetical protein